MESRRFNTVNALLDEAFEKYSSLPAYTCLGTTLTYRDLKRLSYQFASYLQHHTSLKPGDRIAIQLPNVLQYPVALYGATLAGMVIVNTNPLYTERELKHQLCDSGAKALVVLSNVADKAAAVVKDTSIESVIISELGDLLPWPKRPIVNFVVRFVKKMVPAFKFEQSISFLHALTLGDKPLNSVSPEAEDLYVLQYTGGTTGLAKGAMLSHRNLCANVYQLKNQLSRLFNKESEVIVAALPLYHIFAFNVHALSGFSSGSHNVLIPNPRDIPAFVKAVKNFNVTAYVAVNTLYNALLRNESFRALDFSSLLTSAAGGMALTEDVATSWEKLTGCPVCEGYGLTETSPVVTSNPDLDIRVGTIGKALCDTELKLIDDDGNTVNDGDPGELCVRGPQVMQGYWQRPEATAEVLSADGWFKTGDIVVHVGDGYYKIVDRKKDMILVSGFNVYPNEIEDYVALHPDVIEAAAVGVPSDETGEAVKLFVVRSNPSLSKDELIKYCRKGLTGYKVPKLIEFKEDLPKTNVGKILRRELRENNS